MIIIVKLISALALVLGAFYIISRLTKKYSRFNNNTLNKKDLLTIDHVLYVDDTNKIVLISRDKYRYILAINKSHTLLVDKYQIDTLDNDFESNDRFSLKALKNTIS